MMYELPPELMEIIREMAYMDHMIARAKYRERMAKRGRHIAEKSQQRILAQRARAAYARYQQQQARRR